MKLEDVIKAVSEESETAYVLCYSCEQKVVQTFALTGGGKRRVVPLRCSDCKTLNIGMVYFPPIEMREENHGEDGFEADA